MLSPMRPWFFSSLAAKTLMFVLLVWTYCPMGIGYLLCCPLGKLLFVVVIVHTRYISHDVVQSGDAGAILPSIEITCLLGQSCSGVITVHCIRSLHGFKMMCWVTRTELLTIHHRIHCCRIISSLHSTHLLLSACLSMRGAWDQLWRWSNSGPKHIRFLWRQVLLHCRVSDDIMMIWLVVMLKQFNADCHRVSMELWFASASALSTTSSSSTTTKEVLYWVKSESNLCQFW
jgi:hypothetical protein